MRSGGGRSILLSYVGIYASNHTALLLYSGLRKNARG